MVTLTEAAVNKVKELRGLQQREGSHLRIYVAGGGCSGLRYGMALDDNIADDDEVLEVDGLKVLIDPMSAPYLEGAHVDYVETMMGAGFKIDNPNAVATCGCGSSFKAQQGTVSH